MDTPLPVLTLNNIRTQSGKEEELTQSSNLTFPSVPPQHLFSKFSSSTTTSTAPSPDPSPTAASTNPVYMPLNDTHTLFTDSKAARGDDEGKFGVDDSTQIKANSSTLAADANQPLSSATIPEFRLKDQDHTASLAHRIPESCQDGETLVNPTEQDVGVDKRITDSLAEGLPFLQQNPIPSPSAAGLSPQPNSSNSNVCETVDVRIEPLEELQSWQQDTVQPPEISQQTTQSLRDVNSSTISDLHSLPTVSSTFTMTLPSPSATALIAGVEARSSLDSTRSLNVNDALGYLDEVKNRFQTEPDVYNNFLEIMKDFKSKRIDTPRVIERVSSLFAGHPALIQGFNTFLPPGYRIEYMSDRQQGGSMIRVTTPHGTLMQNAGERGFSDAKRQTQDSSLHHPIQPWILDNQDSKELSKDENVDERVKIKLEEAQRQQQHATSTSPLPLGLPDIDAQPLEGQHQQAQVHPLVSQLEQQQQQCMQAPPSPALHSTFSHSLTTSAPGGTSPTVFGSVSPAPPTSVSSVFGAGGADPTRSLNVNDALGYLDEVKNKFQNKPDVYNHFLEIMKDFKSQRIDTPGVIDRVSRLFAGHPALIQGFNTFLPPGYRIDCVADPHDGTNSMIRVTTPQGTMMQSAQGSAKNIFASTDGGEGNVAASDVVPHHHPNVSNAPVPPTVILTAPPDPSAVGLTSHLFNATSSSTSALAAPSGLQPTEQAVEYVNRIKERYADDPASYHLFLDLLQNFHSNPEEVLQQIVVLFSHAPDLLEEFKMFLPRELGTIGTDGEQSNLMKIFTQSVGAAQAQISAQQTTHATHDGPVKSRRKDKERGEGSKEEKEKAQGQTQGLSAAPVSPQKRKRRPAEKDTNATGIKASVGNFAGAGIAGGLGSSKAKKQKHHHHEASPPPSHDLNGISYTNVYQQPQLPQHGPFHPDTYAQAQIHDPHAPVAHPHRQYETQPKFQIHQDATFFDRVRQFLDNRETYDEFLKLLNLFTQELINLRTLVFQAKSFLGETDLMVQFRDMVKWEERSGGAGDNYHGAGITSDDKNGVGQVVKPNKVDLSIRYGPSYRKLPSSETKVVCSGRDAFCNSVLNDDWVSHPSWASEDTGFIAHKKNVYEEALHRSEEERHEYDFYLEAMSKTISVLESPYSKILQMSDSDRINYKFKPNWNGTLKTIHQRLLKKVYGRDAGMEVVQAIQDNPALAIPIVFQRLKQKDEEWKRAQREWNKVWREVDARNYWKSLDHQGVTFKMNDKKNMTSKAFVTNIELMRQQQIMKRASLIDPTFGRGPPDLSSLSTASSQAHITSASVTTTTTSYARPRYQLAYSIEDVSVLQDAIKLILSFLDHTHGTISISDRKKIEQFLRYFVPLFFMYYQRWFDSAFITGGTGGADLEDVMAGDGVSNGFADDDGFGNSGGPSGNVAGSTRSKNGKRGLGDIRKKVLKATQSQSQHSLLQVQLDKSFRRTRSVASASASVPASASPSVPASRASSPPALGGEVEMRDISSSNTKKVSSAGGAATSTGKLLNNASIGFQPPTSGVRKQNPPRGLFFANTNIYVLLRLLNLFYSRLLLCKTLGAELSETEQAARALRKQQNANPSMSVLPPASSVPPNAPSFSFAMTTPAFTSISSADLSTTPSVGAEHFYGHLLDSCERLFDNQIDQATFEDTARYMFGMKAYNVFTVDKVVGAIIKQIQLILSDNKNRDLIQLLQKERDNPSMSLQDQNNYREKAGAIVGPDEHLYRIVYIPDSRTFTIQLLGKDDPKEEDSLAMVEKWEAYVDSFQDDVNLSVPPPRDRYPFLRRNLRKDQPPASATNLMFTRNNMETRFCMRTYRMFFVSHTEDMLYWRYPKAVLQGYQTGAAKRTQQRLAWLERFDKDGWNASAQTD